MKTVFFLMAHPDDEFACSMWIRQHVRTGDNVHCVYATDGGAGKALSLTRRRESTSALALLGLDSGKIHFIGIDHHFGDGHLYLKMKEAADVLNTLFSDAGVIDALYIPAWEGGHQDHDALHLIGCMARRSIGIEDCRQYPLYHGAGLPGPFFRVLSPLPGNGPTTSYHASIAERVLAIRLCLIHRSQWRSWIGLLPFFILKMLLGGQFPFQAVDDGRCRQRAHSGKLLYERRGALDSASFFRKVDEFLGDWQAPN